MTMDPLKLIGTTINQKYEVLQFVGEGGFSVVYRARHKVWEQDVALKIFKLGGVANEEARASLRDGFIREGKLMADLSARSPAIVQARDIGSLHGQGEDWSPFMVLEWLEGESLESALEAQQRGHTRAWDLAEAVHRLDSAASALALAHRHHVVHRDLKPANLFLVTDAGGQHEITKVLDFGVAKVMQEQLDADEALKQTSAQLTAFTPKYGAPEQFSRSYGATGPWTDVFAFALIVLEAARGGHPALGGQDFLELANRSTSQETRPTPRNLGLEVSDAVEAVFERALAVSPQARHPDMANFWRELRGALFETERTWTPPGTSSMSGMLQLDSTVASVESVGAAPPARTTSPTPGVAPLAPAARSRTPWLMGAAVLTIAGAVYWLTSTQAQRPPAAPEAVAAGAATDAASEPRPESPPPPPPCPDGMSLVPGGKFFMGSDDDRYPRWKPAHKVSLDPYCLSDHEITAGAYKACSDRGGCKRLRPESVWRSSPKAKPADHERKQAAFSEFCNVSVEGREAHPMNCVSWADAQNYCKEHGGRLPTEAEWEFAARGSDGRRFPWGDDAPDHTHMNACGAECVKWHEANDVPASPKMYDEDDGFPGTAPVGSFPAGRTMFGMDDMVGNVFEWTGDWFEVYPEGSDETSNPTGPAEGERRVVRGGAFNGGFTLWVDPAFRYGMPPTDRSHGVGFRCVVPPAPGSLARVEDRAGQPEHTERKTQG